MTDVQASQHQVHFVKPGACSCCQVFSDPCSAGSWQWGAVVRLYSGCVVGSLQLNTECCVTASRAEHRVVTGFMHFSSLHGNKGAATMCVCVMHLKLRFLRQFICLPMSPNLVTEHVICWIPCPLSERCLRTLMHVVVCPANTKWPRGGAPAISSSFSQSGFFLQVPRPGSHFPFLDQHDVRLSLGRRGRVL